MVKIRLRAFYVIAEGEVPQKSSLPKAQPDRASPRFAQLAHHAHAFGAHTLVPAVTATGGNNLVPGGNQLADKSIAGEGARAGEQSRHRGRSAGTPRICVVAARRRQP